MVVASCTGTSAKASVAIITKAMLRAGRARSMLGSSHALTVMAARMSTGI